MMQDGFRLANLSRHFLVAPRHARLPLQAVALRLELAHQVFQPGHVAFRCFQLEFGLVPPAVKAGNACGIFKNAAALLRLGIHDLADAALLDKGRRASAGRCIFEQQPYIARADILAIDAEGGTGLAFDAPRDFQLVAFVEFGRGTAFGVVYEKDDFGRVARRSVLRAGENDIVHGGAAHALVRCFAHDPAQGLEQVGLAAAIGPDNSGEARLNHELDRFDEGLEAQQPETRNFHPAFPNVSKRSAATPSCGRSCRTHLAGNPHISSESLGDYGINNAKPTQL